MFFSIGKKSLGEKNYLTREVVYMVITFKERNAAKRKKNVKKKKRILNVKYHVTSKDLPQCSIIYHVLQVNFLNRITVLYYGGTMVYI